MKIDMNKPLLDLDGKQIENETIGKNIARALMASNEGDALKQLDWSLKLYNGETIDLDTSDQETMKKAIQDSKMITNLVKGQALQLLVKGGR